MKSQIRLFAILVTLFALAASCSEKQNFDDQTHEPAVVSDNILAANFSAKDVAQIPTESTSVYSNSRKVIKEGEIAFETKDVAGAEKFIREAILEFEGYIANENIHTDESTGRMENSIEVRIPSASFDRFLFDISSKAGKLDKKNIITKDVTEDYIDTDARIRSKKVLEERYFELLKQGKNIDDILKVENELAIVRNDIELAQGHLNFLENKTSFSTLKITYYEPSIIPTVSATTSFGAKFKNAVMNGWNAVLSIILGLVSIWPVLIGIGIAVVIAIKASRKNKKQLLMQ